MALVLFIYIISSFTDLQFVTYLAAAAASSTDNRATLSILAAATTTRTRTTATNHFSSITC